MTAGLPPDALMGFDTGITNGRHELDAARWQVLRRFETEPPAPESWTPVCLCGRCDGRGQVRIHPDGREEWRTPCRGFVPDRGGRGPR